MNQEEYDSAIAEFCSHVPTAIQGDHRQSLKNRLKYGNEYSLRKRLTDMFSRIPRDVGLQIAGEQARFVKRVVDTRNYFTHYDHDAKANTLQGEGVLAASERLRILVVVNLLHDLGINDETLSSVVGRNRRFQHWMSRDMPL